MSVFGRWLELWEVASLVAAALTALGVLWKALRWLREWTVDDATAENPHDDTVIG